MHILYWEYIVYITCYFCVTWLCIAWLIYSFHPTRVHRFRTWPPKWPTGVFIVPSPLYCHQGSSPLAGWRPRGLTTREKRCSRKKFFPVFSASHHLVKKRYNDTCCVVVQMISFQIFPLGLHVVKHDLLKFNIAVSAVCFCCIFWSNWRTRFKWRMYSVTKVIFYITGRTCFCWE